MCRAMEEIQVKAAFAILPSLLKKKRIDIKEAEEEVQNIEAFKKYLSKNGYTI